MPKFTKDAMLHELRTIFLFEADHILMGAGQEMAEHFIGFPVSDEDYEYCFEDSLKVDLSRFPIAGIFDRGYDFAFRPSLMNHVDGSEVQDLIVFMLGTPRAGGIYSGGELHRFMTADGYCQIVSDAVHGRWKLEFDDGLGGQPLSTREISLLANMTEGAVRNALADKSDNGLRAVSGSKNPVIVEHAEALRWLSGRRGFIPTPNRPADDRFLKEHLRDIATSTALGRLIRDRCWSVFGSPDTASAELGWPTDKTIAWFEGTQSFDATSAATLADRLGFDVPAFSGKALEVIMRRDRQTEGALE